MDKADSLSKYELIFEEKCNDKILKIVTSWNNFKPLLIRVNDLAKSIKKNLKIPVYEGTISSTETVNENDEIEIYDYVPQETDLNVDNTQQKFKSIGVNPETSHNVSNEDSSNQVQFDYQRGFFTHKQLIHNETQTRNMYTILMKVTNSELECYEGLDYTRLINSERLNQNISMNDKYVVLVNTDFVFNNPYKYANNETQTNSQKNYKYVIVENSPIKNTNDNYDCYKRSFSRSCGVEEDLCFQNKQNVLLFETNNKYTSNNINKYTCTQADEELFINSCKDGECNISTCDIGTCCENNNFEIKENFPYLAKNAENQVISMAVQDDHFYMDCGAIMTPKSKRNEQKKEAQEKQKAESRRPNKTVQNISEEKDLIEDFTDKIWDTSKLFMTKKKVATEALKEGDIQFQQSTTSIDMDQADCFCGHDKCKQLKCVFIDPQQNKSKKQKTTVVVPQESEEKKVKITQPSKKTPVHNEMENTDSEDDNRLVLKWDTSRLFDFKAKKKFNQDVELNLLNTTKESDNDIVDDTTCCCESEKCVPRKCFFVEKLNAKIVPKVKLQESMKNLAFKNVIDVVESIKSITKIKRSSTQQFPEDEEYDVAATKWNTEKLFQMKKRLQRRSLEPHALREVELDVDKEEEKTNCYCESPKCMPHRCFFSETISKEKEKVVSKPKVDKDLKFDLVDPVTHLKQKKLTASQTQTDKADEVDELDVSNFRWDTAKLFAHKEKVTQSDLTEDILMKIQFKDEENAEVVCKPDRIFKCTGRDCTGQKCPFSDNN